jgi:hypothetical protein
MFENALICPVVGGRPARCETRVENQKRLTKGKAALLFVLSAVGAVFSVLELHGWHVYLGLTLVGVGIFFGFIRWNRKD